MGKEEEIARIARRLDKMVTRKSAVRGAGRQDPGTPVQPRPHRAHRGQDEIPPCPRPPPGPSLHLVPGPLLWTRRRPALPAFPPVGGGRRSWPGSVRPVCPHP